MGTTPDHREGTTTGILLFDDAEELDFVGPWEVLTMAAAGRIQLLNALNPADLTSDHAHTSLAYCE